MSASRLGVFVCQCGGNISDEVDVERVRRAAEGDPGVVTARTFMFACSDAAQQEMSDAIREQALDGIVVASCWPKLHLETFRAMARRAGLNQYMYTQVNVREQCSWAHRHDAGATAKAVRLVRAGVARTRLGRPLDDVRVEAVPSVLVVGAGPAGLRAAIALADVGLAVHVVEREREVGGALRELGPTFPSGRPGASLAESLRHQLAQRDGVTLYRDAEVVAKSGSVGRFAVTVRVGAETLALRVGAIVVATGFDTYRPRAGELGRGAPGVLTLPEFHALLATSKDGVRVAGRRVRTVAYVYCVGSRQEAPGEGQAGEPNRSCSRYCCTAAVHAAIQAHRVDPEIAQYHLYRDMRTYGRNELLFEEAGRAGSVFLRWTEEAPPQVERNGDGLLVRVRDELAGGEEVEIAADAVVLVTGMVARENAALTAALRLPVGAGGFYAEIHPKLRPVETVVDGVFLAGAAQGPKNLAESVASSLAAAAKCAALLLPGHIERAPTVAVVDAAACVWCGECARACPYEGAVVEASRGGKQVAEVRPELCKGCGGCVPACASQAIAVEGHARAQVTAMIDALAAEVA